jgi:gamma-glutamylcyclotransferase (GGCT)/AIG2-like uncharacterized protein YtfP
MAKTVLNDNNSALVLVYGSLKRGLGNHIFLEEGVADYQGRDMLSGDYTMVDLQWYPGVVRTRAEGSEGRILGEVYRVDLDTLHALDGLEGHPSFYRRVLTPTRFGDAWVYYLPSSYLSEGIVPNGMWRPTEDELQWVEGQAKTEEA